VVADDDDKSPKARETPTVRKSPKVRKQRRLTRHLRNARLVYDNPRSLGTLVRQGLLGIWRARGGGFYGLGYVVCFVLLEIRTVFSQFVGSDSVIGFIFEELLVYLLRLGFMSFLNLFLAFLWPAFLLEFLGGWGFIVLGGGYLLFEYVLRPAVERRLPELVEGEEGGSVAGGDPEP
jgi:hypothetical protein